MPNQKLSEKYYQSRGRRKTAHAIAKMAAGSGKIKVNGQYQDDNKIAFYEDIVKIANEESKWDFEVFVRGGGVNSQKSAIALAIARVLVRYNPELKTSLRKLGYLTRDSREKERKKPGLKRARRAPQWSKR